MDVGAMLYEDGNLQPQKLLWDQFYKLLVGSLHSWRHLKYNKEL